MRFVLVLFLWIPLAMAARSATLLVPQNFPQIQQALDAAEAGDTVLVSEGTYVENLDFGNTPVTLMSSHGPSNTIIDGGHAGPVAMLIDPVHDDTVIQGFTITNGYAYHGAGFHINAASPLIVDNRFVDNEGTEGGAGIFMVGSAYPVIRNNTFERNAVGNSGAAILCHTGAAPLVSENRFLDNYADWSGGGINAYQSDGIRIENNTFAGNRAGKRGGAIRFSHTAGEIRNNIIVGNHSRLGGGGGMCCSNSAWVIIVNNVVCNNASNLYGGGIYLGNAPATLTNNTVCGNTADEVGGGLRCVAGTVAAAANNIFWNNDAPVGPEIAINSSATPSTLDISHSLVDGGQGSVYVEPSCTLNWGSGMIDADPLFVETGVHDYHLLHESPCRDAGADAPAELPPLDFEGDPRFAGIHPDMGADEFHLHLYYTGDAVPGGVIQAKFVGAPGAQPVGLWLGSALLDPPTPSAFGPWYLAPPVIGPILLAPIPSSGVEILPATLPVTLPGPYTIPMQAFIESQLTNVSLLEVL